MWLRFLFSHACWRGPAFYARTYGRTGWKLPGCEPGEAGDMCYGSCSLSSERYTEFTRETREREEEMSETITILLVDDHSIVRQGVRAFLEAQSDLQIVGEAASGEEAVQMAQVLIPDVVLM